ncbi:MAG: ABC transporter ATP-binding protein, partial [Bacteroidales bacterium]|nr:ABC transporter ATP-binding protein [Bacteroidales bacterium]
QEFKALEVKLQELEDEKAALEGQLSGAELSASELSEASERYGKLLEELDAAETRWLELSD